MKFFDRLLTIVITATLTSAIWIVFGGPLLNDSVSIRDSSEPQPEAPAQPASLEEANQADDTPRTESTDESEETPAPAADQASASELLIPVAGIKAGDLSDSFLDRRGENDGRLHEAIDIMAPKGTAVVAAIQSVANQDRCLHVIAPSRVHPGNPFIGFLYVRWRNIPCRR